MEILKTVFGSHLYGLETPNSDYDYKTVFIPSLNDILLSGPNFHSNQSTGDNNSKNNSDDVDIESFSISRFIDLACKGETIAIDMLHSRGDSVLNCHPIWGEYIRNNRKKFYTKSMKAYLGYVQKQASKYSIKGSRLRALEDVLGVLTKVDQESRLEDVIDLIEPSEFVIKNRIEVYGGGFAPGITILSKKFPIRIKIKYIIESLQKTYDAYGQRAQLAKENKAIDWKALSHALRAGYQLRAIYKVGDFVYPLEETPFLLNVKLGNLDFLSKVQPEIENLVEEVCDLSKKSSLPEKVDRSYWDGILLEIYYEVFGLNSY